MFTKPYGAKHFFVCLLPPTFVKLSVVQTTRVAVLLVSLFFRTALYFDNSGIIVYLFGSYLPEGLVSIRGVRESPTRQFCHFCCFAASKAANIFAIDVASLRARFSPLSVAETLRQPRCSCSRNGALRCGTSREPPGVVLWC